MGRWRRRSSGRRGVPGLRTLRALLARRIPPLRGDRYVFEAGREDVRERVREITAGRGVDAVVDTTSAPASEMVPLAIELVKRKEGRIVVQSRGGTIPAFPIEKLARKYITLKPARGHSYA